MFHIRKLSNRGCFPFLILTQEVDTNVGCTVSLSESLFIKPGCGFTVIQIEKLKPFRVQHNYIMFQIAVVRFFRIL